MKNNIKPLKRDNDIVVQDLKSELLVYNLKDNTALCLNETSALVWNMCDGTKSISEIAQDLSKKLKSSVNEDYVWLAIDQLKKESLLANAEDLHDNFAGMNRRDVIKKVGLASMIALPLVAGIVAPNATHAASTCNASCNCNATNGTIGNFCNTDGGNGTNVPVPCPAGCRCQRVNNNTTNSGNCVV